MDLGITAKMVVREAMSSPVISIYEDQNIVEASKIMSDQRIGSIVVVDNAEKPLGILTERDLVYRVVAKDLVPREIAVKEVMSSPLKMVDPDMTLEEAIRVMERENIRRLGVTYKGKLEGVITDRDILRLMPTLIEIIRERSRIRGILYQMRSLFLQPEELGWGTPLRGLQGRGRIETLPMSTESCIESP